MNSLQSMQSCIACWFSRRQNTIKLLTIVEFNYEWMLHIHQNISFFFSSQAIANCKWQNEQQTFAFKTLHKGQQTDFTDIIENSKSDCNKKHFKKQHLLGVNKLSNSIFLKAITFDDGDVKKTIEIRIKIPISNFVHFTSFSRKLSLWKWKERTLFFEKKNTHYRKWKIRLGKQMAKLKSEQITFEAHLSESLS